MYSAESVIAALKANTKLMCKDIERVECPNPAQNYCNNDPDNCEKGKSRNCKQQVTVHQDYTSMLCVLFFRFMISPHNHGGFIDSDDIALGRLIRHNWIDKSKLEFVA